MRIVRLLEDIGRRVTAWAGRQLKSVGALLFPQFGGGRLVPIRIDKRKTGGHMRIVRRRLSGE